MKIGYARVSKSDQDLTAQIEALMALGVDEAQIHTDPGMTGANRSRPGLDKALAAASRPGDELVVTKMDRLARSIRDAQDIAAELQGRGVGLRIGQTLYDPNDPIGKMLFHLLAMFAEFERDLIVARTKEGMAVARERGRLKGKKPKLSKTQEKHLVRLYEAGEHTTADLAVEFGVGRATVYRAVERAKAAAATAD